MKEKLKKNVTIDDFYIVTYVPWDNIEEVLGKRRYKKFGRWMRGQTCLGRGVYPDDLDRFLRNLPIID